MGGPRGAGSQSGAPILTLAMRLKLLPIRIRKPFGGFRIVRIMGCYAPIRASAYPVYAVQSTRYAMPYGVIRGDAYLRIGPVSSPYFAIGTV